MHKGILFSEKDIEKPAIAELIEAKNVDAINALIADKYVASCGSDKDNIADIGISEAGIATASLENDEEYTDVRSFMKSVLFKK